MPVGGLQHIKKDCSEYCKPCVSQTCISQIIGSVEAMQKFPFLCFSCFFTIKDKLKFVKFSQSPKSLRI